MKDVLDQNINTKDYLMRSLYKWMDQLLLTKQISKYLQRKRTKSKMIHNLMFPVTYYLIPGSKTWDVFLVSIRNQIR